VDKGINDVLTINAGDGFVQGLFVKFGVTVDDEITEERNGEFGSTTKRKE
jgi:dUTP pyrophosphatase